MNYTKKDLINHVSKSLITLGYSPNKILIKQLLKEHLHFAEEFELRINFSLNEKELIQEIAQNYNKLLSETS